MLPENIKDLIKLSGSEEWHMVFVNDYSYEIVLYDLDDEKISHLQKCINNSIPGIFEISVMNKHKF